MVKLLGYIVVIALGVMTGTFSISVLLQIIDGDHSTGKCFTLAINLIATVVSVVSALKVLYSREVAD
jgi:hypothetical protein